MQGSDIGVEWPVWRCFSGACQDIAPIGATPHWRRRSRRQPVIEQFLDNMRNPLKEAKPRLVKLAIL